MTIQMSNKNNITVLKIPNEKSTGHRSQTFPRMPRLYLELLENKSKIKQDLINTEYVHDYDKSPVPGLEPASPTSMSSSSDESMYSKQTVSDISGDSVQDNSVLITNDDDDDTSVISDISDKSLDDEQNDKVTNDDDSVDVKKRLGKLLQDDDSTVNSKRSKYSKRRDKRGKVMAAAAPSLNELEKNGSYIPKQHLRDVNNEKVDDDMKRELLFKFQLLRKTYPKASLPEFTIHTDYQIMLNNYEDCVRRLSLDSSVENYKQYLIYGFMGCEFLLGKFFKLDMEGFTQQQILSMSSYEKLLIELGEKSYIPEGSRWPVELRLLFLVIMNAAFFIVSKMLMKNTGANIMNMVNSVMRSGNPGESKPKKKMRGPDIDLEDILEV
jgi:hypothetical protein